MSDNNTKRWIIAEATEVCARIAAIALAQGFEVALSGEVLFTGRGKQMDLVLLSVAGTTAHIEQEGAPAIVAIAAELQSVHRIQIHSNMYLLHLAGKQISISIR